MRRDRHKARAVWAHVRLLGRVGLALERGRTGAELLVLARQFPRATQRSVAVGLLAPDGVVIDFVRDGIHWRVDTGDEIGQELYVTGEYEGAEIAAVLHWLAGRGVGSVVVDVGANVGTTAIPVALAGYSVVAIEPVPATFAMLTENVQRNALADRIQCVNAAIVDEPGEIEMWTGFGSGQAEVTVSGHEPAMTRWGHKGLPVLVAGMRLDGLDLAAEDVALVWADVQGSETSVMRTGAFLWRAGVPLYLEVDPESLELHGGLNAFVEAAEASFRSFVPSDGLLRGAAPQPIAGFGPWVGSIRPGRYRDALLLPG